VRGTIGHFELPRQLAPHLDGEARCQIRLRRQRACGALCRGMAFRTSGRPRSQGVRGAGRWCRSVACYTGLIIRLLLPRPAKSIAPVRAGQRIAEHEAACGRWLAFPQHNRSSSSGISWQRAARRSLSKLQRILSVTIEGRRCPAAQLLSVERRPRARPGRVMIGRRGLRANAARRIKVSDMRSPDECISVQRINWVPARAAP